MEILLKLSLLDAYLLFQREMNLAFFVGERCVRLELIPWLLGQPYMGIYVLKLSGVNMLFRIKVRKVC